MQEGAGKEGATLIWQMIEDWFRGILTDGILSNLSGLFDSVNTEVGEIAAELGVTPITVCRWETGKTEPSIKAKKAFRDLCERKGLTFGKNNG